MKYWILVLTLAFILVSLFPLGSQAEDSKIIVPIDLGSTSLVKVSDYTKDSPYTEVYYSPDSKTYIAVISQLPRVNADGVKVQVGWTRVLTSFVALPNQFEATVTGTQITLRAINAQPTGAKKGDYVTWDPKLYIGGKEIKAGEPRLLAVDPLNPNYHYNTIEWNYGSIVRRVRIIEGLFSERWIVYSDPGGSVEIDHNSSGSLSLNLGYGLDYAAKAIPCYVIGDTEMVYSSDFKDATYPVEIGATSNFVPDGHPETSSVDGLFYRAAVNEAWATIRVGAGTGVTDSATILSVAFYNGTPTPKFSQINRSDMLFNTAALPDTATIDSASMVIYFYATSNTITGSTPAVNVFGSNPASSTVLVTADFQELQNWWAVPYSTAVPFTSLTMPGNNTFVLNAAGKAAINMTGISKFSQIESFYDATGTVPPWESNGANAYANSYSREQGLGYSPTLIVTYTVTTPPTVNTDPATDISYTTATLWGNITDTGTPNVDERGFDWDVDSGAPYANSWTESGAFGNGTFSHGIAGLPVGTQIFFRAKVHNVTGWVNGTEGNFTTLTAVAPNMTLEATTAITSTTATVHGNITATGGVNPTIRGFEWDIDSGTPYANDWHENGAYGTGAFSTGIASLPVDTKIYLRTYAINVAGQGNSTEGNFTTLEVLPLPPTNMTVIQTGVNSVSLTWTKGLYADNTTVMVHEDEAPANQYDGWQLYFGEGTTTNMTGLNLGMTEYFFTGYSSNSVGNSTGSMVSIGGGNMVFIGWMAFFGIFWLGTLWAASKWPEWLIKLANSLFAAGAWYYLYFGTTPAKLDFASNTGIFLSFAFLILMMVPWLIQMNVWNRQEVRREGKGGVSRLTSYESYNAPPSRKKSYNDAYWNYRERMKERLQGRRRR